MKYKEYDVEYEHVGTNMYIIYLMNDKDEEIAKYYFGGIGPRDKSYLEEEEIIKFLDEQHNKNQDKKLKGNNYVSMIWEMLAFNMEEREQ